MLNLSIGHQKLPKFDINYLKLLFHCNILIPRKCPRKTPFKAQCPPQLTLTQTGLDYAHHITCPPPGFLDLPMALSAAGVQNGNWSNSISPGQLNMSK